MTDLIPLRAEKKKTALGHSTIYKRMSEGAFPRPVRLGPKRAAWVEEEIDAYIAALISTRDEARR